MKNTYKAIGILLVSVLCLTGCQESKEKYALRETGIEQLNGGSYEEAIQSFDQALERSDRMVGTFELDVLKYRAEAEYKVEDYAAAAHTYTTLIEVDGEKPEYLNMRCLLYGKTGELDLAIVDYQTLSRISKDSMVTEATLYSLGQVLSEADRTEEAMELYQQAQAEGVKSAELYNRMGLCEMEADRLDEALYYFEQGLLLEDSDVTLKLLYNQAAAYEQKQNFKKALEILETYVVSYGTTAEVEKEIAFLKTR